MKNVIATSVLCTVTLLIGFYVGARTAGEHYSYSMQFYDAVVATQICVEENQKKCMPVRSWVDHSATTALSSYLWLEESGSETFWKVFDPERLELREKNIQKILDYRRKVPPSMGALTLAHDMYQEGKIAEDRFDAMVEETVKHNEFLLKNGVNVPEYEAVIED